MKFSHSPLLHLLLQLLSLHRHRFTQIPTPNILLAFLLLLRVVLLRRAQETTYLSRRRRRWWCRWIRILFRFRRRLHLLLRNRDSRSVGRAESVKPEHLMAETCSKTQGSWAWEMMSSMAAESSTSERSENSNISRSERRRRRRW